MIDSIKTDLCELRWIREDDRAKYIRMEEVSRDLFTPWVASRSPGMTLDDSFDEDMARDEKGRADGTGVRLAAFTPDGKMAGIFVLSQIFRRKFQNAYAGWRVSADKVGQGLGTSGVTALLDLAFVPEPVGLGLHRVQANIIPSNAASVRLAEKTGFRVEGLAKSYLKINGVWQDHQMYAKLAEEHEPRFLAETDPP